MGLRGYALRVRVAQASVMYDDDEYSARYTMLLAGLVASCLKASHMLTSAGAIIGARGFALVPRTCEYLPETLNTHHRTQSAQHHTCRIRRLETAFHG